MSALESPENEPAAPAGKSLTLGVALRRIGSVVLIAAVVLVVGAMNGVGPLAQVTPPSQVTDPREMLTRSLQAMIDASSVHLDASLGGVVPGDLLDRSDSQVRLDGTRAVLDLRPQDARSHLVFGSPPLGIDLEALTLWDTLSYRASGGVWTKGSLAGVVAGTGIDANPLTLVGRLRTWLAAPGAPVPTATTAPCDAPSGLCRDIRLAAGTTPGDILLRLFPAGRAASIGPTTTDVFLESDAATLQPAHLVLVTRNADGTLAITLQIDATLWDWPSVIADPPSG